MNRNGGACLHLTLKRLFLPRCLALLLALSLGLPSPAGAYPQLDRGTLREPQEDTAVGELHKLLQVGLEEASSQDEAAADRPVSADGQTWDEQAVWVYMDQLDNLLHDMGNELNRIAGVRAALTEQIREMDNWEAMRRYTVIYDRLVDDMQEWGNLTRPWPIENGMAGLGADELGRRLVETEHRVGRMVEELSDRAILVMGHIHRTHQVRIAGLSHPVGQLARNFVIHHVVIQQLHRNFVDRRGRFDPVGTPRRVDLVQFAGEMEAILQSSPSSQPLQVECLAAPDTPDVWIDPVRLYEVLNNLAHNAARAAKENGRKGNPFRAVFSRGEEGSVRLEVSDEAGGMEPETLQRLLAGVPFTTKDGEKARGHGRGMGIIRSIVHGAGGDFEGVSSTVGQGTQHTFSLPALALSEDIAGQVDVLMTAINLFRRDERLVWVTLHEVAEHLTLSVAFEEGGAEPEPGFHGSVIMNAHDQWKPFRNSRFLWVKVSGVGIRPEGIVLYDGSAAAAENELAQRKIKNFLLREGETPLFEAGPTTSGPSAEPKAGLEEGRPTLEDHFIDLLQRAMKRDRAPELPPALEQAFRQVDRGHFVPGQSFRDSFGSDYGIKGPVTLPSLIAWMVYQAVPPQLYGEGTGSLAQDRPLRILVVGAGPGYSSAILSRYLELLRPNWDNRVIALEVDPEIAQDAARKLADFGNVEVRRSDPEILGLPDEGLFDAVIAFAATPNLEARDALGRQLAIGGRLVLPWGSGRHATLEAYQREESGFPIVASHWNVRFVELVLPSDLKMHGTGLEENAVDFSLHGPVEEDRFQELIDGVIDQSKAITEGQFDLETIPLGLGFGIDEADPVPRLLRELHASSFPREGGRVFYRYQGDDTSLRGLIFVWVRYQIEGDATEKDAFAVSVPETFTPTAMSKFVTRGIPMPAGEAANLRFNRGDRSYQMPTQVSAYPFVEARFVAPEVPFATEEQTNALFVLTALAAIATTPPSDFDRSDDEAPEPDLPREDASVDSGRGEVATADRTGLEEQALSPEEQRIEDRIAAVDFFARELTVTWFKTAGTERPPFEQFARTLFGSGEKLSLQLERASLRFRDLSYLYWDVNAPPQPPIVTPQQVFLFNLIPFLGAVLSVQHLTVQTITDRTILELARQQGSMRIAAAATDQRIPLARLYDEQQLLALIRRYREVMGLNDLRVRNPLGRDCRLSNGAGITVLRRVLQEGETETIQLYSEQPEGYASGLMVRKDAGTPTPLGGYGDFSEMTGPETFFVVRANGEMAFVENTAALPMDLSYSVVRHFPEITADDLLGPEQAGQEERVRDELQELPRADTGAIHLIGPGLGQHPGLKALAGLEEGVMVAEPDIDQTLVRLIGQGVRTVFVYGFKEWTARFKVQAKKALVTVADTYVAGQAAFAQVLQKLLSNMSGLLPKTVAERVNLERLAGWLEELA